jgi:hypothetical protein
MRLTRKCADAASGARNPQKTALFPLLLNPGEKRESREVLGFPAAASRHEKARRKRPAGYRFSSLGSA